MTSGTHLILFDGVCGLCNGLVRFVLPRDRRDRFRFAPLQAEEVRPILARFGRNADDLDTFYVIENFEGPRSRALDRDRAAIFILERLGFPWVIAWVFNVVPRFLRRPVYNFIARRRYRWFGKFKTIPLPPDSFKHKFLWMG
jgi:predicted DCC family thiol-disulfide oxidoreductase YuxK